jgi:integrase
MIQKLSSLKTGENRYHIIVSVRDGGKIRQIKRVFHGAKWEAEAQEAELKKELRQKMGQQAELDKFQDILEYYVEQHLKYKKSYEKSKTCITKLKNDLGQLKYDELTIERLRQYLRQDIAGERKGKLQNGTLNRLLSFAKAACQFALENRKIPDNPFRNTKQLKLPEQERNRILSDEEWARLQQYLPDWLKPIITFAYLVPTRLGELIALRKEWIQGDRILLPGSKTKTGQTRYLPIPPQIKAYFDSIPKESDFVFYRKVGDKYLPMGILRADGASLGKALKAAKITNFRFHDFRHTAASNLRRKNIRIELIMAIGGWKTLPTFFRYSNYTDQELVAAYA